VTLARERDPFKAPQRSRARRLVGTGLGVLLVGLALGALGDVPAGASRITAVALVLLAYGAAASLAHRLARRTRRPLPRPAPLPASEGEIHVRIR
jgi:hypothetical protein